MSTPLLIIEGTVIITCVYSLTLFLHIVLPGRFIEGYACADDNGNSGKAIATSAKPQQRTTIASKVLLYKLNGALVLIISLPLGCYICDFLFPFSSNATNIKNEYNAEKNIMVFSMIKGLANFYERRKGIYIGGNLLGVIISMIFFLRGKKWVATAKKNGLDALKMEKSSRCITKDQLEIIQSSSNDATETTTAVCRTKKEEATIQNLTNSIKDFYTGKGEFNPRSFILQCDVDWKMWLYLAGTVALEMHVFSMVIAHALVQSNIDTHEFFPISSSEIIQLLHSISRAMASSAVMWTWFCLDYLTHEEIHLYTYDLFAERLGLKLIWGCLGVYPFIYPFSLHCLVQKIDTVDDLSAQSTVAILALFLFGWFLTRGANNQKFAFKVDPKKKDFLFCGILVKQLSIEVRSNIGIKKKNDDDDELRPRGQQYQGPPPRKILVSGWWGLARHLNYMGEIVQGLAMSLPSFLVTKSPVSFVYFAFITALLLPRQKEDNILCRKKYGTEVWDEYTRLVPSKVVPFIY
mmetsp:Transcript_22046/g.29065  ORF Transcript_22046/g.29065 Transcript_22046/m.29065 type:complete len:521 (-) Transcript_22046:277-1839(-)